MTILRVSAWWLTPDWRGVTSDIGASVYASGYFVISQNGSLWNITWERFRLIPHSVRPEFAEAVQYITISAVTVAKLTL